MEIGWTSKILRAQAKVVLVFIWKSPAYSSRCNWSSSGWQGLPRCQFHHNISIRLKSAPSNFRRHWIKSLSAVEVRQRLVWGSKAIASAKLTSSEPGDQTWLSQELSHARETGRGGPRLEGRPQCWALCCEKQEHGERQRRKSASNAWKEQTHTQTSLHACVFNYVWYMKPHRLFFILPSQYDEKRQATAKRELKSLNCFEEHSR